MPDTVRICANCEHMVQLSTDRGWIHVAPPRKIIPELRSQPIACPGGSGRIAEPGELKVLR